MVSRLNANLHEQLKDCDIESMKGKLVDYYEYKLVPLLIIFLLVLNEDVYYFPVLTESFCDLLMSEIDHFQSSGMPCGRPNTMNYGGVLLSELGLDDLLSTFRERYIQVLVNRLYPQEPDWCPLDSHRGFTVSYELEGDTELAWHYDNSEVNLPSIQIERNCMKVG